MCVLRAYQSSVFIVINKQKESLLIVLGIQTRFEFDQRFVKF